MRSRIPKCPRHCFVPRDLRRGEVGGDDFYLDLLFYHLELRSFVIIDLKSRAFSPEAVGKMNFYVTAVDEILRHPSDPARLAEGFLRA